MPVLAVIAEPDHASVGETHATRSLHLQEEQLDRIVEIEDLEPASLERALVDLLARVIGHEPIVALAHGGEPVVVGPAHLIRRHCHDVFGLHVDRDLVLAGAHPRASHFRLVIAGEQPGLPLHADLERRVVFLEEGARRLAAHGSLGGHGQGLDARRRPGE